MNSLTLSTYTLVSPTNCALEPEDLFAAQAFNLWLRLEDPARALRVIEKISREFLEEGRQRFPRTTLEGHAHALAGRDAAAKVKWGEALRLVEQRLATESNQPVWIFNKALLLAFLGQREAAKEQLAAFRQLGRTADFLGCPGTPLVLFLLGETDAAVAEFQREMKSRGSRMQVLNALRFDPLLKPIRDDPRVQAMIEEGLVWLEEMRVAAATPKSQTVDPRSSAQPLADQKSVAVLAFVNISAEKDTEYFSDGISEELLNVLAKVPGLKVTARTSAFHFKGKDTPIPEIARQLGVAYVVEGSVRWAGTQLRISARLLNAADGKQVWADDFREELKDVFALQDKIAGIIAQNLRLTLGTAMRKARTVDPEAYRLLLEGRYFFNRRDPESFTRAEAAFTAALKIDPELAEAHAGLAGVYVIRANFRGIEGLQGFDETAPDLRRARLAAQRAIEIDPTQAEAHGALGFALMLENRLTESEQEHLKAIALNPNSALAHAWLAGVRYQQGRADLAAMENDKTSQLDPHLFINLIFYAQTLAQIYRYEDAWKVAERAAALRAETYIPIRGEQARILLALGRNAEAAEVARDILRRPELTPRFWADSLALWVLRQTGSEAEAQGHTAALLARLPANSFQRGFILGSVGRFDEALPFLENTAVIMMMSLMYDQMWDPFRVDPRFEQLMAKLGRAAESKVARETLARMRAAQLAEAAGRRARPGGGNSK